MASKPKPLQSHLPWTKPPLIVSAPMRLISGAAMAHAVSYAGGLGFIGAGTDLSTLPTHLDELQHLLKEQPIPNTPASYPYAPIGIGVITHLASLTFLQHALSSQPKPPAAIWLFAPEQPSELVDWATAIRRMTPPPQVWIQTGSVSEAMESVRATHPDVLVVQGADAGGHGLQSDASIVPLIPEISDAFIAAHSRGDIPFVPHIVAAGGIVDGRGVAAAMSLGAQGVTLGTRFLATPEANVAKGYKDEVMRAYDGGLATVRSRVYDFLRGTNHWPARFGGRSVVNASWDDWLRSGEAGQEENREQYQAAEKKGDSGWGPNGRMTTYAGTGVGLVKGMMHASDVVRETRAGARQAIAKISSVNAKL